MISFSECVVLANRIVEGLRLNIPRYQNISDIQIPHLVEIHCRLLNLNFEGTPEETHKGVNLETYWHTIVHHYTYLSTCGVSLLAWIYSKNDSVFCNHNPNVQ